MRGSVVKKGQRYYIVYTLGKKQKWEKVPEPNTKKNAEKLLAQRVAEINRGEYREIKKVTFAEFTERWLRDYVDDEMHIKASSAGEYRNAFRAHLLPFFEQYDLKDISPDLVQEFISQKSKTGLSTQTIRNYLTPLTKMFNHAVQWGYLRTSPMPFVQKPKVRHKEMAFLSAEEVRRFLQHVPEQWYAFFLTAVTTGMRLGELLAMRWVNLDWEAGQYHVKERLYKGRFDTPKNRTSMRTVDLTPNVLDALKAYEIQQNKMKLRKGPDYQDAGLIFCRDAGTPILQEKDLQQAFNAALEAAENPQITLHGLRHTYASLLIAQGESPKYIQRQLGHASIQMTFDLYGHLMPEARHEAVRKLDAQVFGTG